MIVEKPIPFSDTEKPGCTRVNGSVRVIFGKRKPKAQHCFLVCSQHETSCPSLLALLKKLGYEGSVLLWSNNVQNIATIARTGFVDAIIVDEYREHWNLDPVQLSLGCHHIPPPPTFRFNLSTRHTLAEDLSKFLKEKVQNKKPPISN